MNERDEIGSDLVPDHMTAVRDGRRADRLPQRGRRRVRPAGGVALDKAGALLVADDVGNTVWRVTAAR